MSGVGRPRMDLRRLFRTLWAPADHKDASQHFRLGRIYAFSSIIRHILARMYSASGAGAIRVDILVKSTEKAIPPPIFQRIIFPTNFTRRRQ